MSKFHLISTFDYEIFGDGSGCLKNCLLTPIEKMLSISDKFDAPQTFFVDFLEFASLKVASDNNHALGNYYQAVEEQLKSFVGSRHNVQFHLHPQWLGAEVRETEWTLDFSKWRIGDLNAGDLNRAFDEAFAYIESIGLLQDERFCKVFRAGGWAIQPSKAVLSTLKSKAILVDSTVAPGASNWARGDWYNFKSAPRDLPMWNIEEDVCSENAQGELLEVPIATQFIGRKNHIKALRELRQYPRLPRNCVGSYNGPNNKLHNMLGKLSKILNIGTVMLDTSTLPAWALIEATEKYMQRFSSGSGSIPIVTIGHNKNFTDRSEENFSLYLEWLSKQGDITLSDYNTLISHPLKTVIS